MDSSPQTDMSKRKPSIMGAPEPPASAKKQKKSSRGSPKGDIWSLYNFRLLKSIYPDLGISKQAMSVMNSFINDMFDRLVSEASKVRRRYSGLHISAPQPNVVLLCRFSFPARRSNQAVDDHGERHTGCGEVAAARRVAATCRI